MMMIDEVISRLREVEEGRRTDANPKSKARVHGDFLGCRRPLRKQ
jgi:hypothetical protein